MTQEFAKDNARETSVVITQPMYFPWVGMLQQVKRCNTLVFYNDVQYSKRNFTNRVQVKTSGGRKWLTVPLRRLERGQRICDVGIDNRRDWQSSQRDFLRQAFADAPYRDDMLGVVDQVFSKSYESLADVSRASMVSLMEYFELEKELVIIDSETLAVEGDSTQRLVDICLALKGQHYITGHGARNYLEHERFEEKGISVSYLDYRFSPYPQSFGDFTPYVTALDLVAHCGRLGAEYIQGGLTTWRDFIGSHG